MTWFKWFSKKFLNKLDEVGMLNDILETSFGKSQILFQPLRSGRAFDVREVLKLTPLQEDALRNILFARIISKDDSESVRVQKIAKFVNNHLRYMHDKENPNYMRLEYWADPYTTFKIKKDDCFTADTNILTSEGKIKTIKELKIGDKIIGENGNPTTIINKSYKGKKEIYEFTTNIGGTIRVSGEHTMSISSDKANTKNQKWIDKKATEIRKGDQLEVCNYLSFDNRISIGYDYGYLLGLYLADGWIKNGSIYIAGKNGHPKQKQKEWVRQYCEQHKIKFTMRERYCYFRNPIILKDIENWFGKTGAKNKKITQYAFDLDGTKGLLDGMKADAHERAKDLTYSTINENIAHTIRIWHRHLGYQCSIRKVVKHGGLGKNPIYRIGVKRYKSSRVLVKKITKVKEEPTYNITTTSGKVYLPDQDVVVRQCDGYAVLIMKLMELAEIPVNKRYVVKGFVDGGWHAYVLYFMTDYLDWFVVEGSYYPKQCLADFGVKSFRYQEKYHQIEWFTNEINSYAKTRQVFEYKVTDDNSFSGYTAAPYPYDFSDNFTSTSGGL